MRYVLLTLLVLLSNCEAFALEREIDMKAGCKNNPQIGGACFSVHGRLSAYNGAPSLRIWPIGTHRLLGVLKDQRLGWLQQGRLRGFSRVPVHKKQVRFHAIRVC